MKCGSGQHEWVSPVSARRCCNPNWSRVTVHSIQAHLLDSHGQIKVDGLDLVTGWQEVGEIPRSSQCPLSFPGVAEINDSERLDAIEALLTNCPHARIIYNDDKDAEDPVGFTLRVAGCETSEDTAPDLRACLDFEVRRQRDFATR